MSPEIHGALVGGALGGIVVLIGICFEAWIAGRRSRDERRRRLLIEGTDVINRARPLICAGGLLADSPGTVEATRAVSDVQRVFDLGLDVLQSTRRTDRRSKQIRSAAIDLIARWSAANSARHDGKPFALEEVNNIDLGRLRGAVLGKRTEVDIENLVLHYRLSGFSEDVEPEY